ncbi:MAG: hypothetical protein ISS23_01710 [Nanoarchaeota archaeon]|nr:hypothetical protein [Nanoarchaeota archaeon]
MEKLENLANKLYWPLYAAWAAGTLFLQNCGLDLPPILETYANTCGDYMYPAFLAGLIGPKGAIIGAAACVAAEVTDYIPYNTPDLLDIPAAIIGGVEGYFYARYKKRKKSNE